MNPILKKAYQPYKWIIVIPFVFMVTMISGLAAIITGLLFSQEVVNRVAVIWAKLCSGIVPLKVHIRGRNNYSRDQSYVIVANHQSMVDIPILHGHLGLNIKWIMKKELGEIPIFGSACQHLGCICVDRSDHDAALKSIQEAEKKLTGNASVFFFAEGTRSRDGKVMSFKKGAFKFAGETHLPLLPVTIKNALTVLPSGSLDLTPGHVEIIVHRPIALSDRPMDNIDEIIERTRRIISSAL